jgi:hypothetical protein
MPFQRFVPEPTPEREILLEVTAFAPAAAELLAFCATPRFVTELKSVHSRSDVCFKRFRPATGPHSEPMIHMPSQIIPINNLSPLPVIHSHHVSLTSILVQLRLVFLTGLIYPIRAQYPKSFHGRSSDYCNNADSEYKLRNSSLCSSLQPPALLLHSSPIFSSA